MVCCSDHIDYIVNSNKALVDVDTSDLMNKVNATAIAVSFLKENSQQSLEVKTLGNKIVFTFSFVHWKDYINIVEETLLKQVAVVRFLYDCSQTYSAAQY